MGYSLYVFFISMNFSIGEDNEALKDTIHKFSQKEIAPIADKVDKENTFPNELWKKLGDLGLLGITADQEFGGSQMSYLAHCIAMEELVGLALLLGFLMEHFQICVLTKLIEMEVKSRNKSIFQACVQEKKLELLQ